MPAQAATAAMPVVSLPAENIHSRSRGAAWFRSYQRTACSLGGAAQRGNAPLQPALYIDPGENFSSLENGSVFPWETAGNIAPPLHPSEIIPSTRMSSETDSAPLVRRLSCSWTPPQRVAWPSSWGPTLLVCASLILSLF